MIIMLGENPSLLAADCRNWTLTNSASNAQTSLPILGISNRFSNGDCLIEILYLVGWIWIVWNFQFLISFMNRLATEIGTRVRRFERKSFRYLCKTLIVSHLLHCSYQFDFNFCCSLSNFFSFCLLSLIERTISQIEKFATPHRLSLRWNPGMSKGKTL